MNWTSAQHRYGDGDAYRRHRDAYFDEQDRVIREQCATKPGYHWTPWGWVPDERRAP
jgi:hypothetical protein